jgi:hypothetical protein
MKRLLTKNILILLVLCSSTVIQAQNTDSVFWQNLLYGTVAVGATISAAIWAPQTVDMINKYGFFHAVQSTHVPRIALDALTIGACVNALYRTNCKQTTPEHR